MKNTNPHAWESDFPPVYSHTSLSFLKHCPGYTEARLGNLCAALIVAAMCVKPRTVYELKQKYPDAILLPVLSNNKLPEALARTIGMKTHTHVHKLETAGRKSMPAMDRILHRPEFKGDIVNGKSYILVDDVITQGGTVAALRKHVIDNGGSVSAITALSCSVDSNKLVPERDDVFTLLNSFTLHTVSGALSRYEAAPDPWEMTRSQVKYLLRFRRLERLAYKIEKAQINIDKVHSRH